MIYIEGLWVESAYRNRRIVTEMLKRMSQVVDMNDALAALQAFPVIDGERCP